MCMIPYSRKFSPGENFRLFRPGASWAKIFSANYFTQWKFCHAEIFTRTRSLASYMWLPTSSASWSTVSWYSNPIFLNLQSCLMSLLSYFHVTPRVLPDPFGPLSAELSPSAIAEANAAVNGMQQAKIRLREVRSKGRTVQGDRSCWGSRVCEYGTRYSGVACSFESSTHYFLVSNSRCGRN